MIFGQISNSYNKYSSKLDYLQFDICGLSVEEARVKLDDVLEKNNFIDKIILHSDWSKNKISENNLPNRIDDYIQIKNELSKSVNVIGLTLHPMFKNKASLNEFNSLVNELKSEMTVFVENRSNHKILISEPSEVIEYSKSNNMTIDIPQLLISCQYDYDYFLKTLSEINWFNVCEIHLANLKRDGNRTYVGRNLDDGIININDIKPYLFNKLVTLEILHGSKSFEKNVAFLKDMF